MPHKSLKTFAENARKELRIALETQLHKYRLPDGEPDPGWGSKICDQHTKLKKRIEQKGQDKVIEEAAFTWFNRLCALRLMEVRGYIPRCLSSSVEGRIDPDLLHNRFQRATELGLNSEPEGSDEEVYRKLLLAQCNQLHEIFPFLFEKLGDEDELLLPSNLLSAQSIRGHLLDVDTASWQEVEVIGWLYQYYISERKSQVIGKVVKKDDIPAATQLFTPQWIVDYMVQNSLGTLWLESWPDSELKQHMPYYIELGDQEPEVLARLEALRVPCMDPTRIKVLDPACGSGHILVRAFDILFHIYEEQGYANEDISLQIIGNNLFGLDIDARAAQMAGLALVIKGRERDTRFFERMKAKHLKPHVEVVSESNGPVRLADTRLQSVANQLVTTFEEAGNLGSLIEVPKAISLEQLDQLADVLDGLDGGMFENQAVNALKALIPSARILRETYDVVIANPPYMGGKFLNKDVKRFATKNYKDYKSDLFSVFSQRVFKFGKSHGLTGLMTPFVWMFIKSYERFRQSLLKGKTLSSLVRPEYHAFFDSAFVPLCSFVLRNKHVPFKGGFVDLQEFYGAELQPKKLLEAIQNPDCGWFHRAKPDDFDAIPGAPIAYWVSDRMRQIFREGTPLGEIAQPAVGLFTCNNNRFLRRWWEVSIANIGLDIHNSQEASISEKKWFPYNKGGEYRKWFGNNEYVVNYKSNGREVRQHRVNKGQSYSLPGEKYYFKPGITWSFVSSSFFGVRTTERGFIFDVGGSSAFPDVNNIPEVTSFLCSDIAFDCMKCMNPTLNFQVGNVASLPYIELKGETKRKIIELSNSCVFASKQDWDAFERSWDYKRPKILSKTNEIDSLESSVKISLELFESQIRKISVFENELNKILCSAYGLTFNEANNIEEKITLTRTSKEKMMLDFLSYSLGNMMGRYSLDEPGLIHAGQPFEPSRHTTFPADDDGIIPILEENWFDDDVVNRFVEFVRCCYGEQGLDPSLQFVAEALGGKADESPEESIRRYFVKDFIKDHVKTYKKRPIYWLFTSHPKGRSGGAFQALVYLHRYQPNTIAMLRTKYLRRYQEAVTHEIEHLEKPVANEPARFRVQREKNLQKYRDKLNEVRAYDEKLKHYADQRIELDLDDGVAYNYTRFADIVYWDSGFKEKDLRKAAQWKEDLLNQ